MKFKFIFTFIILISQLSFAQTDLSSQELADVVLSNDGVNNQYYLSTKFRGLDKVLTLIETKDGYKVALTEKGKYPNQTWVFYIPGDEINTKIVNIETDMEVYGYKKEVRVRKRTRNNDKSTVYIKKWDSKYYQFLYYVPTGKNSDGWDDIAERAIDIKNSKENTALMAKPGRYTGQKWFLEKKASSVPNTKEMSILADKSTVILKATNGKYVSVRLNDGNKVIANVSRIGNWEKLVVEDLGNNTIALKASDGKYLSARVNDAGVVTANASKIGDWEKFTVEDLGNNTIALKTFDGWYVSARLNQGGKIIADAKKIGNWERFTVVK